MTIIAAVLVTWFLLSVLTAFAVAAVLGQGRDLRAGENIAHADLAPADAPAPVAPAVKVTARPTGAPAHRRTGAYPLAS